MPQAKKLIEQFTRDQIQQLVSGGCLPLHIEGETFELKAEDVQIERKVKEGLAAGNAGELTVALDTTLNEALLEEGMARELINKINTLRREMDFEVTDRIEITMETSAYVQKCFEKYQEMIVGEVLAVNVVFKACDGVVCDLNGETAKILLKVKVNGGG